MRYQGKIINWKDEQGFGFVIPNGGGEKAFVHIKAFSSRSQRPAEGMLITYEMVLDENRRYRAKNIRFANEKAAPTAPAANKSTGTIFSILFCAFLAFSALIGRLPFSVLVIYLTASIACFIAYAMDKSAAQNNRWRTKESTLHLLALAGGWPGALLAQKILRHKSKKKEFQTIFWITAALNSCTLAWFVTKGGAA